MVYLIVLIVFLYPILRQSSTKNNISPKYYWLQLVLIILVAGLRNHVGGDTIGYMRDWESVDPIGEIDTINVLYLSLYYRPLCLALMYLSRTISSEFFVWQLIQATIVNVAAFYIIKKESKYYYEVALLYLLFQFLYFNMEIMRESLAVSAFYFAFKFFDKRKWFAYYLSLIVVFFFHERKAPFRKPFFFMFLFLVDLRTSGNKRLACLVVLILVEVLDEPRSQILCLFCPYRNIRICVPRIQDACVNAWQLCRNLEIEVRNRLCWSILDITIQDCINDTTRVLDRDTLACAIPTCVDQIRLGTALFHSLDQFLGILCWMKLKECLSEACGEGWRRLGNATLCTRQLGCKA